MNVFILLNDRMFQVACGFEFINKLNRMFTDIGISSGLNQSFSEYLNESKQNQGLAPFHIHVLSAGFWPLNHTPAVNVRIPEDIQRFVNLFKEFYDKKFTGRRLFWLHHLCSGNTTFFLRIVERPKFEALFNLIFSVPLFHIWRKKITYSVAFALVLHFAMF